MNADGGLDAFFARARKRPWTSLILVLSLVIGLGVLGGLTIHARGHDDSKAATAVKVPEFPRAWDPRVLPIVKIVEKYRGLKFLHPVYVDFYSSDQFAKKFNALNKGVSPQERANLLRTQDTLRALGLAPNDENLAQDVSSTSGADVVGFYSFDNRRVWVRNTQMTAAVKQTLVHELTHALDDQHFHLGATSDKIDAANGAGPFPYSALVEGDARRIESVYSRTLSKATLRLIARQEEAELKTSVPRGHAPWIIGMQGTAAYPLGEIAVERVARKGGNRAVNRLFLHPPAHQVLFVAPWLLDSPWKPKHVVTPPVGHAGKAVARGEFGALSLYFLLSETGRFPAALKAAEAWGGDQYVTYAEAATACIHLTVVGRTTAGTQAIDAAATTWAQESGAGSVSADAHAVTIYACSSDVPSNMTYPVDPEVPKTALDLLTFQNTVEADVDKDVGHTAYAVCFAQALPQHFNAAILLAGKPSQAQRDQMRQIAYSCAR